MSILLDSDALIYFFKEIEPWRSYIDGLLERDDVSISMVSVMEICAGWDEKERRINLPDLYETFTIEPVTQAIAERAGILRHDHKARQKRRPRPMDALIAATALEGGFRLITNNRQDFNMDGLSVCRELWQ